MDGPSFGLWLGIHGAGWPYDTPLPKIEHTLNGCMLFEALDSGNMAERLSAGSIDSLEGNRFILVVSTVEAWAPRLVEGIFTRFMAMGVIVRLEEGWEECASPT